MKNILSLVLTFTLSVTLVLAQGGMKVSAVVVNGDTIPLVVHSEIRIVERYKTKNAAQELVYWKLKRDVKKVYPYAILAEAKLKEYNRKLNTMPAEADRKLYMKHAEVELKKQFEKDLKKLTVTQGRLLIKLIDRQTGKTSYDLVKDLRGSFSAFMWQSLASLFGSSLKTEYDAKGKDRMTEHVIHLVESGEI